MTIHYNYYSNIANLAPDEINTLEDILGESDFRDGYYITGDFIFLDGDIEVDDYITCADDVADDIRFLLRKAADVEVFGNVSEPDDYHQESYYDEQMRYYDTVLF